MCRAVAIVVCLCLFSGMVDHRAEADDPVVLSRQLDQLVKRGCVADGLTPLESCHDSEFLRRVWLDLAGRIPPLTEVVKLASGTKLNRQEVVLRLLKSSDFSRHWGRVWTEYLTERRPFETEGYDGRRLQQFLTESFHENRPYDEVVRDLLTGEGTSDTSGAVNFLLRYDAEPVPLAGAVSRKFLGLSLHCAECHDHPHARWKQMEFWGLAAHFARLRKMTPTNPGNGEMFFAVIERPRGELLVADKLAKPNVPGEPTQKTVFPQLPGLPRTDAKKPRRGVLVEWLVNSENPYLSRHLVNLVWERLIGEKLVSNLDQWPLQTQTTESELLNLLAEDCILHHWDVQRLVQIIAMSETYHRSSHEEPSSKPPTDSRQKERELTHWSRARIRPLSADQLHLSIAQAFAYHHDEEDHRIAESTGEDFTQDIPANNLGTTPFTLGRAISLYNSDYIRGAAELGVQAAIRLYGPSAGVEQIERLFMLLLSRLPTTEELELFQDLASENEPQEGLNDVVWVLLNSTEFVTNH